MTSEKSEIELLYKNIEYASSQEWLNSYLDLVKMFLDATGIKNNDERLDMSFSAKPPSFLSVVVNNRFIILGGGAKNDKNEESSVCLLFKSNYRDFPELRDSPSIRKQGQFDQLPSEKSKRSKPPYYISFYNLNELLTMLEKKRRVYDFWIESIFDEIDRAQASPYRESHQPLFHKLVVDKKYRVITLDRFFSGTLPEEVVEPKKLFEGTTRTVAINAYERNPVARSACIEHYGAVCVVCGMDFESRYGKVGEGFIHVHHLKPLGGIGKRYKIDPIADMRPVCPNCHAVLHKRNPVYSIKEVKTMLRK